MINDMPLTFTSADIGNPALKGSTVEVDGGYDVAGGGVDIWGERDEFHFLYTEINGDFDIRGRLSGLTSADPYTKAGFMARESLDESARHAYFQVFPDNSPRNNNNGGFEYQFRLEDAGEMKAIYPSTSTGEPPFPVAFPNTWLRLERRGNQFSGYASADGLDWKTYSSFEQSMSNTAFVGLAVTSHNAERLAVAKFRDVAIL